MRAWLRLPCFFNIILLSWHAFGLGLSKASCACSWWLSRCVAFVDLCGEHRWIAAIEVGWSQGFMARPVGHFQCWTYICWGHFPHNCQASSMSISICVCVCVCVCVGTRVSNSHKVMTALVVILPSIFLFVEILLEFHRYAMLPSTALTGENCRKTLESHYHLRLLNWSLFIFNNREA
jgi:hypothetical protein